MSCKVKCNYCEFEGTEDDLVMTVEFEVGSGNGVDILPLETFNSKYKDSEEYVFIHDRVLGCPNCLTDEYLTDYSIF